MRAPHAAHEAVVKEMITHSKLGKHPTALFVAEELQNLYEPEVNPRTMYCLNQNPQRKALMESGEYDPAAENRRRIAELRELRN